MPSPGRIPTDGLKFRQPIQELEEILLLKIQRARDSGDKESASLYKEVLNLARKKAESIDQGPGEDAGSREEGDETP